MSTKRFGVMAAMASVLLVVAVAAVGTGVLSWPVSWAIDKLWQWVASVAGVAAYLWTARQHSGIQRRWRLWMAGASASLAAGMSMWMGGQVAVGLSLPSWALAPLGFLMVPLFVLLGVLTLAQGERAAEQDLPSVRRSWVLLMLDGLIVVGSLFVLVWVTAVESMGRAWVRSGPAFATEVIAHPLAYVVLLAIVVMLPWTRGAAIQLPVLLLAIAFLAQSTSGWIFAYLVSRGAVRIPPLADAGFMATPVFFTLAAVAPSSSARGRAGEGSARPGDYLVLLVPYLPLLVTALFIVVGTATGVRLSPPEVYVGLTVVALVIVRQLITLVDNMRLLERVREGQQQLEYQAFHDSLTGLPNRAVFLDRLDSAVATRERQSSPLMLLFVDVDGFKAVNDSYGHAVGDMVLRTVAERLKDCVHACDTVARLGGDEFGVLLDGVTVPPGLGDRTGSPGVPSPDQIGDRVLAAMRVPHAVNGDQLIVSASIGTVCVTSFDPELTADELLGRADAAMYTAKRRGKGTLVAHGSSAPAPTDAAAWLADVSPRRPCAREGM
jgi:diguanylate cyclase (GGDEF)-like protein